jgi:hypothetical protein
VHVLNQKFQISKIWWLLVPKIRFITYHTKNGNTKNVALLDVFGEGDGDSGLA